MSIKYPNNWVYQEYPGNTLTFSNDDYSTVFVPPSEVKFLSNLTAAPADVYVSIAKQRDLPYKNMPLDVYFDYIKKLQISRGNNITSTGKTNLTDGTPAYEIDISDNNHNKKGVIVIMNKSPESYYLSYAATPKKFNTYLPVAMQMIKTLSFAK
jgi:hypothetical protein